MRLRPTITSPQNPYFRQCLTLRDNRKSRRHGRFLIDGQVEIDRAIESGVVLELLLIAEASEVNCPGDNQLIQRALARGIEVQPLSKLLMEKLSYGERTDQPVAVAKTPQLPLSALSLDSNSLVLVLDRIEKPGNLGACLRSAAAVGVDAVVLTSPICDAFNANAIRSSRGSIFRVPMAVSSCEQISQLADRLSLPIFAGRVSSQRTIWELPLAGGAIIVLGNESAGLGSEWQKPSVLDFTIPMTNLADSLNLSISAAVSLFEARRQRMHRQI